MYSAAATARMESITQNGRIWKEPAVSADQERSAGRQCREEVRAYEREPAAGDPDGHSGGGIPY